MGKTIWQAHEESIAKYKLLEKEFINNIKSMLDKKIDDNTTPLGNSCFTVKSSMLF